MVVDRSKGVPSGTEVFLRLLLGELWTLKFAQMFAYGKWLYPNRRQLHGTSELDQRCLKMRNSHQISSPPTPKITPKPHFGGPFNAKPIIQINLCKSYINRATKVKLYSYIGIGKYSGCVKIFPLGSSGGSRALNVNLGPPIISETTGARKLKLKTQLDVVKYLLSCDNYRGVSLLSHCGKVMTSIILQRIRLRTEEILTEAQAGFLAGRSTIDQLFTLRRLAETYIEFSKYLYVCYVDFKKVFDSVW